LLLLLSTHNELIFPFLEVKEERGEKEITALAKYDNKLS